MSGVVLDASGLLAWIQAEPGAEIVEEALADALMCSVNWSEVVQKLQTKGVDTANLRQEFEVLGLEIHPFDAEDAEYAARLWPVARSAGISLADRACLALGLRHRLPVLTTDRSWQTIDTGVQVRLLRK